jgi:hypothetical protein
MFKNELMNLFSLNFSVMKYSIVLAACLVLFAQCRRPDFDVQPTGSFDTLGIKWMTIERSNIIYYFQGTGVNAASIYTDLHEDAYDTLNSVFKAQIPQKLRFFVWTNWEQAEQLLGYSLGFAVPWECVCNVMANQTLGHEMTHVLSFWADGILPTRHTKFINEGVAVAFDLSGRNRIDMAKEAVKGKNIHSVAEVWADNSTADEILYPLGGAFVDFLFKKGQREKFDALLKYQTIEDAEYIYGKEQLDALIAEFNGLVGL